MQNELYDKYKSPPEWAIKTIIGGRLKGFSDINPQWRIDSLTETYGLIGFGWKFEIKDRWTEEGPGGIKMCFIIIDFFIKHPEKEEWSSPIQSMGGSKIVEKEKDGLYCNDEGFKMALTDAISVACKFLGIGSDIYRGKNHFSSKYEKPEVPISESYNSESTYQPKIYEKKVYAQKPSYVPVKTKRSTVQECAMAGHTIEPKGKGGIPYCLTCFIKWSEAKKALEEKGVDDYNKNGNA